MGKTKHKKHHRHGDEEGDGDDGDGSGGGGAAGLKLILKVGSKGEKHKKKKKKKDKKKEHKEKRHKHHHKEKHLESSEDVMEVDGSRAVAVPLPVVGAEQRPVEIGSPGSADLDLIVQQQQQQPQSGSPLEADEVETVSAAADHVDVVEQAQDDDETRASRECLAKLLEHMLHHFQKKDTNGFFANPVNDAIAPGYSSIITHPMDFSTMRSKLASYENLAAFQADFELICANAMTYNAAETIYHKTAKSMLQFGLKLFTKDKIKSMRRHLPFAAKIPDQMLGLDVVKPDHQFHHGPDGVDGDEDDDMVGGIGDVSNLIEDIREVVRRPPGRFEAIPDDMTAAEILLQAKMAARGAANRLKIRKNNMPQMGFLRQKPDGTTSLQFLTGAAGVVPGTEKDRPVLLGQLIGKVKQGTGSVQETREDLRNLAKTMYPLYYGAYSSHAPSFDSTFANLTKEETDLVYQTYFDTVGVQYAESILNFSRNCEYARFIVDSLLNILTLNEHRKTIKYIEEQKKLRREEDLLDATVKDIPEETDSKDNVKEVNQSEAKDSSKIDFDSLRSLQDDGIDMSFLDGMKSFIEPIKDEPRDPADENISNDLENLMQENAQLLETLKTVQNDRLGSPPPPGGNLGQIGPPSDREMEIANKIRSNLVEVAKQMRPGQVMPGSLVRRAMQIRVPL